jgi:SpoVK/Ycf46/Vps4 family AAA+-type ATPase
MIGQQENTLWVESFRPDTLEGYIGNEHIIEKVKIFISNGDVPHLLFYGSAGTGKTTLAKIIANSVDADLMYINASDENSVDAVRDKIKRYASTVGFRRWKIIILDEADYLTPNAQAALRNLMETYSKTTRFILTCNYVEKIIDPIQSRCQTFAITPPNKTDVAKRLVQVLEENENLIVVEDDIAINSSFYKNISNGLNMLKKMGTRGLVSGFSPINYSGSYHLQNKWRKSIYFSCWGWGCNRDTWAKYESNLSGIDLDEALKNSHAWSSLSSWQKNLWKSRFRKVQQNEGYTWDLQMQFASFANEFTNLVPLFRFTDNEGFNDERATHTKEPKPKWMNNRSKNDQHIYDFAGIIASKLFGIIDALTIVGDSRLLSIYKNVKNYFKFNEK